MKYLSTLGVLLIALVLAHGAEAACAGVNVIANGNDAADPIIVNEACNCIGWGLPIGVTVFHYHLRIDGELYASTIINETSVEVCLPAKDQTLAIDVYASLKDTIVVSPVSDTTYIRWQDSATPTPVTPTPATPTPATPTPATPPPPVVCYETQEVEVPCP